MGKKSGFGKFAFGALVGVGLGMLFSPKSGKENQEDLKKKIEELKKEVKKIDVEDVKRQFQDKILQIQDELEDMDKEKAVDMAKKTAKNVKDKSQELVDLAIEKGSPILRDAADAVREKTVVVTRDVLARLEKQEKVAKKENK